MIENLSIHSSPEYSSCELECLNDFERINQSLSSCRENDISLIGSLAELQQSGVSKITIKTPAVWTNSAPTISITFSLSYSSLDLITTDQYFSVEEFLPLWAYPASSTISEPAIEYHKNQSRYTLLFNDSSRSSFCLILLTSPGLCLAVIEVCIEWIPKGFRGMHLMKTNNLLHKPHEFKNASNKNELHVAWPVPINTVDGVTQLFQFRLCDYGGELSDCFSATTTTRYYIVEKVSSTRDFLFLLIRFIPRESKQYTDSVRVTWTTQKPIVFTIHGHGYDPRSICGQLEIPRIGKWIHYNNICPGVSIVPSRAVSINKQPVLTSVVNSSQESYEFRTLEAPNILRVTPRRGTVLPGQSLPIEVLLDIPEETIALLLIPFVIWPSNMEYEANHIATTETLWLHAEIFPTEVLNHTLITDTVLSTLLTTSLYHIFQN